MQILLLGAAGRPAGWPSDTDGIQWIQTPEEAPAGALLVDLLFDGSPLRVSQLRAHPGPVWVNDVPGATAGSDAFVRINGWNGFGAAPLLEAAAPEALRAGAEEAAALLGKKIEWLPDVPGFVSPRVIAGIINEAYHALSEGVSSKEAINTAMKLGTNYPHGPFEWASIIGLKNVAQLLEALAKGNERYAPNELLLKEATR
ncbi:3-hydroxyacyl-CoA dehydrogenase family protein [Flaviaesturariibacter aridisoli]|uniref:3-hydroxyacyl-CoA dehydrogenase n=1 Tax=Flaviaesturariibacter aridisoli TaxID=2545761 RepID=A0A4R4E4Y9_9BACT|nr:3-hydroxyacyl-CoA dehydrogenase family protein [Flaviaesturariibacter aridisoli]TCZ73081.1 3-hydroxyacyl-CoA dehydrogenase [Flaviaesturariibacter aridisoli]